MAREVYTTFDCPRCHRHAVRVRWIDLPVYQTRGDCPECHSDNEEWPDATYRAGYAYACGQFD